MTQKTFAGLLKTGIILAALFCLLIYALYVPVIAGEVRDTASEFAHLYTGGVIFVEATALPIAVALVLAWLVSVEIGRDNSFCRANATRLKGIAYLALGDVVYFWAGILIFGFAFGAMSGPAVILALLIGIAGLVVSICAGALSHLTLKAALLREENDLTV